MPVKVVDASALAAVLFAEPEADAIAGRLHGSELAAPTLLPFEIASVCLKKIRRHPDQRSELLAAYRLMERMAILEIEVNLSEAVVLAEAEQLTIYDASYLWLAHSLDAELVTLDAELTNAAARR